MGDRTLAVTLTRVTPTLSFNHVSSMSLTCPRVPGPPVFQRATLKNWVGPGDEASSFNEYCKGTMILDISHSTANVLRTDIARGGLPVLVKLSSFFATPC